MQTATNHGGDFASTLMGILAVALGKVLGAITIQSLTQAFILGAVGALAGYLVKKILDWIWRKIKK